MTAEREVSVKAIQARIRYLESRTQELAYAFMVGSTADVLIKEIICDLESYVKMLETTSSHP